MEKMQSPDLDWPALRAELYKWMKRWEIIWDLK